MKSFTIENETNNITVHATKWEATSVPNTQCFSTAEEFGELAGTSDNPPASAPHGPITDAHDLSRVQPADLLRHRFQNYVLYFHRPPTTVALIDRGSVTTQHRGPLG